MSWATSRLILRKESCSTIADFDDLAMALRGPLDHLARPDFQLPVMPEIRIPPNPFVTAVEANYASEFYRRLMKWISDFDSMLDETYEVGVRLVSFGQTVVFHLSKIGFWDPSLMSFEGLIAPWALPKLPCETLA